jgi:putative (di)nucleoside polyphosphate hydrolase
MKNVVEDSVIDADGYRRNVGIVLCNSHIQVLWARRSRHDGWQFPQGGVESEESAIEAVYRELYEEVGLSPHHVRMVGSTRNWLRYDVPVKLQRANRVRFRGQKQMWFLLQMLADDSDICLDLVDQPEFDQWQWVDYWTPVRQIISFKRDVYRRALTELEPLALQATSATNIGS